MTDKNRISRRTSLKGIAASSALIGGSILGVNSASATDKNDKKGYDSEKKGKKGKRDRRKEKKKEKGRRKDRKDGKGKKDGKEKRGHDISNYVAFNFEGAKPAKHKAEFYLHHGKDKDLTFTYKVRETGKKGKITVRDTLATAETFWVKAPDGKATVKLYYKGTHVGTASSYPDD
ncbi:hypothetical protein EA462_12830 [Natrarchaeobius halalkaliphilus]|uniref:Uncharacterized protein n=1 Tax=Natrarchaeobius halalkaliphilus TaxID=1679091 RepID=A0A3N6LKD3_9EURY|nr:hypothetical protein [Natrarchaeobius halalkaliphilus]RQG89243.1 hypothetical protein EA462_12830 [Natrarchaeobius halalkaliphilus]